MVHLRIDSFGSNHSCDAAGNESRRGYGGKRRDGFVSAADNSADSVDRSNGARPSEEL